MVRLLKGVGVGDAEAVGLGVVSGVGEGVSGVAEGVSGDGEGVIGADSVAAGVGFSGATIAIVLSICLPGMPRSR